MTPPPGHLLNLGCGTRTHPDWLNYDLNPVVPGVRRADFVNAIPLPDASAAAAYHSHLLEHLPPPVARRFIRECKRVLAPGGVLRIVVPDFEASARDYLDTLDRRRKGLPLRPQHHWLMVEMFEQMVRTRPGGLFYDALAPARTDEAFRAFVAPRLGTFGADLLVAPQRTVPPGRFERLVAFLERWLPGQWGRHVGDLLFRRKGDVHQWMYDELSLTDLLTDEGFTNVQRKTYLTSDIPNWSAYGLDAEPDGRQYKGVSLYLDARRPAL